VNGRLVCTRKRQTYGRSRTPSSSWPARFSTRADRGCSAVIPRFRPWCAGSQNPTKNQRESPGTRPVRRLLPVGSGLPGEGRDAPYRPCPLRCIAWFVRFRRWVRTRTQQRGTRTRIDPPLPFSSTSTTVLTNRTLRRRFPRRLDVPIFPSTFEWKGRRLSSLLSCSVVATRRAGKIGSNKALMRTAATARLPAPTFPAAAQLDLSQGTHALVTWPWLL